MAKLTDPDELTTNNLTINTTAKTFTLVAGQDGLVAKDGVTLQAVYSKFIKLWETSAYNKYPFPMYAIDALSGQFQFGTDGATYSGWKPATDATRQMLRDGGWSEYTSGGVLDAQYVGIVSLGNVNSGAQLYYQRTATEAAADFTFEDEVNEGILVYDVDPARNTRSFFKGFVREQGYKFKDSVLGDTGKTATGAFIVNMLLSNEVDLDITDEDVEMTNAPYKDIKIRYFDGAYAKDVDIEDSPYAFGVVIDVGTFSGVDGAGAGGASAMTTADAGIPIDGTYDGGTLTIHEGAAKGTYTIGTIVAAGSVPVTPNLLGAASAASFTLQRPTPVVATLQEIYTRIQYDLRQDADIDATAGTVNGKTASLLLNFVGPTLIAGFYAPTNPNGGGAGVMVEGIRAADVNSITFYDNTYAPLAYPYASAGNLNFNSFLTAGSTGYYRMYFTDPTVGAGDAWGEDGAVTVNDSAGNPIEGTIGAASIAFTFDYTGNVQGGRTPDQDAAVTVVAGNKGSAKPVVATGLINESKAISITMTAEQDRAYTD
jgi:hypothetical protein